MRKRHSSGKGDTQLVQQGNLSAMLLLKVSGIELLHVCVDILILLCVFLACFVGLQILLHARIWNVKLVCTSLVLIPLSPPYLLHRQIACRGQVLCPLTFCITDCTSNANPLSRVPPTIYAHGGCLFEAVYMVTKDTLALGPIRV